jgi:hypothetical protein
MALLRNFTTNDGRSRFKLDLVLGQSGAQAPGRLEGLRRCRDPILRDPVLRLEVSAGSGRWLLSWSVAALVPT